MMTLWFLSAVLLLLQLAVVPAQPVIVFTLEVHSGRGIAPQSYQITLRQGETLLDGFRALANNKGSSFKFDYSNARLMKVNALSGSWKGEVQNPNSNRIQLGNDIGSYIPRSGDLVMLTFTQAGEVPIEQEVLTKVD